MPEQRVWTYRPRRSYDAMGTDRLGANLARHWQTAGQPVSISLTDMMNETGLSSHEAIRSLSGLAQRGLIAISPLPRLRQVGQDITYIVVWLGPAMASHPN